MFDLENKTDFTIGDEELEILENITNYLTKKEFELILTDNAQIQELNKIYRNIDKPTDVLSFPLEAMFEAMPIGSIIISVEYAKKIAIDLNHKIEEEIFLLFIHGLLHLLGYDHETDNGEMREKERDIIEKFNLPKSLIIRNI